MSKLQTALDWLNQFKDREPGAFSYLMRGTAVLGKEGKAMVPRNRRGLNGMTVQSLVILLLEKASGERIRNLEGRWEIDHRDQTLRELAGLLRGTASDEGCDGDLVVVSKRALNDLLDGAGLGEEKLEEHGEDE